MGPWRGSNLIKERERGEGRGTANRHGKNREEKGVGRRTDMAKTERKEKEKGKKRMGASGPLAHDFVLAFTPFICICYPFISEKPPPRGCRHCWPNHVKYCVYCRAFSPSNLCLIELSHPIGLPSCPNTLLKRFRTYPFATRVFWWYN